MDMTQKIKMAEKYAGISESELARKLGKTPQAFGQRVRTGKFSAPELEDIAKALGGEFVFYFQFPNGDKV